jgi:MFS family permease
MAPTAKKGYYGWTIVFSVFVVIFLSFSIRGSFSNFLIPMQEELGWSTASISAGYSIFICVYGITAFFSGGLLDKYGPKPVFITHGCLLGLGLFLSSFSREPWQFFLTYGLISGLGAGGLFSPPMALTRKWFIKGLGKASGICSAAGGLGFGLAPIVAMHLIEWLSWHDAMKIMGVILTVGVVLAALRTKPTPESIGEHPPGYEEAVQASASSSEVDGDSSFTFAEALRTSTFWILITAYVCCNFAEFIFQSQTLKYVVKDIGLEKIESTYIYSLFGFFHMLAGPTIGIIVDRLTVKHAKDGFRARKRVLLVIFTLAIIAAVIMLFAKNHASYALFNVLFGICAGSYIPTMFGCFGDCFGRKHSGRILGTATLFGQGIGGALGPFFGGLVRDVTGSYLPAFIVGAVAYLCACIFIQLVKPPKPPIRLPAKTAHCGNSGERLDSAAP